MFCHIIHVAVKTACQPFQQIGFSIGQVGIRYTNGLKTKLPRPGADIFGKLDILL